MTEKYYIAGAHSRARTLAEYMRVLYPEAVLEAYLVNNEEPNPDEAGGVPVIHFCENTGLCTDYAVLLGTRSVYHHDLTRKLQSAGFQRIYPVTADLDLELRNAYLKKYFIAAGRKFTKISHLDDLSEDRMAAVYVAKSVSDKPLRHKYTLAAYEKEIQAGSILTQKRIMDGILTDDTGDNISHRNRQFCELTVIYWIWKHAREKIVGLVHYRRHFMLPPDWLARMQEYAVDVILPVPLYVAPSLADNYKERHDPSDWDYMMEYLKENYEEDYSGAEEFFQKNLYSPCNMFIMRKEVLCELCEWMFPILFAVADHGGEKENRYLNRYPGFLSERLITYFFEKNRDRFRIVYADKNFLT